MVTVWATREHTADPLQSAWSSLAQAILEREAVKLDLVPVQDVDSLDETTSLKVQGTVAEIQSLLRALSLCDVYGLVIDVEDAAEQESLSGWSKIFEVVLAEAG